MESGGARAATEIINPTRSVRTITRTIVGLALICCLTYYVWHVRSNWLPRLGRWLDVGEPFCRVDYVISLPGDENYRPFVAAAMVNTGFAQRALIVQNKPSPAELDGVAPHASEIVRRVYKYCGVPESKLTVLHGASGTTADDIDVLARFLENHPTATAAIVTSDYHTRRSRWTLRRRLGRLANQLNFVSAPNGIFDSNHWWQTEGGFVIVLTEYMKLIAYAIFYGRAVWWLLGTLLFIVLCHISRRKSSRNGKSPS